MVADFYKMLGVDPKADRSAIEAALVKCQPIWSSGTRNPKNKHTFQSYLDQIPSIRRTLLADSPARAAYDAELSAAREAERRSRLDRLQRLLNLRSAQGGLTVSDRKLLREAAVKLGLTVEDLDRMAEAMPPRPESPAHDDEPVAASADVLDGAIRRQIRSALDHIHRKDLYDVLDLARDAPMREVLDRADAVRKRWMQKAQVTAEKTAWLEAVSFTQSHLTSRESRLRYDHTLELEAEEAFRDQIAFALEGRTRIDPATRQALLNEAHVLIISQSRADALIDRYCLGQCIKSASTGGEAAGSEANAKRVLRCRGCGGLSDFAKYQRDSAKAACPRCRTSLRWSCPACQKKNWIDENRCTCGFRLECREPLIRHFEAAQHAYKIRDYTGSLVHLERVQEYAPYHVGARKGVEIVKTKLAEIEHVRLDFESELARKHVVAALRLVESWGRMVEPGDSRVRRAWSEVSKQLREARTLAAHGSDLLSTDPVMARQLLRQSLAIASDLEEARQSLDACPPDPPDKVGIEIRENVIRLDWSQAPPAADGSGSVRYRLVRKRRGVPEHSGDGESIAVVEVNRFEDQHASPGDQFGYSIFSMRGQVESIRGCSTKAVWFLPEVLDVRVQTRAGEVDLAWTLPDGAIGVRVVRKLGSPPTGPGDGEPIPTRNEQSSDCGLIEDHIYHYALYAQYQLPDGVTRTSKGVLVAASPIERAAVVESLRLERMPDRRIRLAWDAPGLGKVKILRSTNPTSLLVGSSMSPGRADSLAGEWLTDLGEGQAFDTLPPDIVTCHYIPLIALAGRLTVGKSVLFSTLKDPTDLCSSRVGNTNRLQLRWRWDPEVSTCVVVACEASREPVLDDPSALVQEVSETEYKRSGYHLFTLPVDASITGPWRVRVFSVAEVAGSKVFSAGSEPSAEAEVACSQAEVAVGYMLKRPWIPGRSWSLVFRTEPPGSTIPPTLLVAHPRALPVSVDDGEVVARFPVASDGARFAIDSKRDFSRGRTRLFADPTASNGFAPLRFVAPDGAGTRV